MRPGLRLSIEIGLVVIAGAAAYWLVGLPVVGCLLVMATVVAGVVVVRLVPDSDAATWPLLPAPERAGRRAEAYHLSWQATGEAQGVVRRLRSIALIWQAQDDGADPERTRRLTETVARLEGAGARDLPGLIGALERLAPDVSTPDTLTVGSTTDATTPPPSRGAR